MAFIPLVLPPRTPIKRGGCVHTPFLAQFPLKSQVEALSSIVSVRYFVSLESQKDNIGKLVHLMMKFLLLLDLQCLFTVEEPMRPSGDAVEQFEGR